MKKLLFFIAVVGLMAGFSGKVMGQAEDLISFNLPEVKIIGITGTPPTFTFVEPTTPGDSIGFQAYDGTYLQYTSVIPTGTTHTILVALKTGSTLPGGIILYAGAVKPITGDGDNGTSTGFKSITSSTQDFITGIGSCWTGTGDTDGAQLLYKCVVDPTKYHDVIKNTNTHVTVSYTIVAGS